MTAGVPVQRRRARSSGTIVEVWRAVDLGDEQSAPWLTLCEHASICEHETRALAVAFAAEPEAWCEVGCRHGAEAQCCDCGSRRVTFHGDNWACDVCGVEWACYCSDETNAANG